MKSLDEAVEKFKNLKEKLKNLSQQPKNDTNMIIVMQPKQKENIKNYQNTEHMHHRTSSLKQEPAAMKLKQKNNNVNANNNCSKAQQSNRTTTNLHAKKIGDFYVDTNQDNDSRDQTKKKEKKGRTESQHRKNHSWNFEGISKESQFKNTDKQVHNYHQNYPQSNKLIRDKFIDVNSEATEWKIESLKNSRTSEQQMSKDLKNKQKMLYEINNLLQKKRQVLEVLQRKIGSTYLDIEDSNMEQIACKSKKTIRAPNLFQMQVQGRKRSQSKPLTIRWK